MIEFMHPFCIKSLLSLNYTEYMTLVIPSTKIPIIRIPNNMPTAILGDTSLFIVRSTREEDIFYAVHLI